MADQIAGIKAVSRLTSAGIGATYADLGSVFNDYVIVIMITNSLNGDVMLSFDDGVTDHIWLPAGQDLILDLRSNGYRFPLATQIQIKDGDTAPTSGTIALTLIKAA